MSDQASLSTIIAERLAALRSDLVAGQRDLAVLDDQRETLRVALLRLSGAVQALSELAEAAETGTVTLDGVTLTPEPAGAVP